MVTPETNTAAAPATVAAAKPRTLRLFSWRMYKEGLAQLALPGFIMGGIFTAIAVLQGWSEILWWTQRSAATTQSWTSIYDAWYPIMLYVWTAPFLFSILLFNFLNSRKKSDFYHALSVKRETLFLSFAASIYTWVIATVIFVMAIATTLFAFAGASFSFAMVIYALVGLIAAALYGATITMLAMALTGTLFSNIAVLLMLLWTPPLVSALFKEGVESLVPGLPFGEATFFGLDLSIVLLRPTFFNYGSSATFRGATSGEVIVDIAWTGFLVAAMLLAATFLFARRKSEVAGSSAPNRLMQAVFRVGIALPPLFFIAGDIAFMGSTAYMSGNRNADLIFSVVAALVISLIIMCVFELISTKRWRNLLKVPLSFGIALVLTLTFTGFIWAVAAYEASFAPSADNIAWVAIPRDVPSNNSQISRIAGVRTDKSDGFNQDYWQGSKVLHRIWEEEIRVDDADVRFALSKALVELRDEFDGGLAIQNNRRWGAYLSTESPMLYDSDSARSSETLVFEIRTTGGMTKRRVLPFAESEWVESPRTGRNNRIILPNELGNAFANIGQIAE